MKLFACLVFSLCLIFPVHVSASHQKNAVVTFKVKNLGERKVEYSRSYSGVYNSEYIPLQLSNDSTATLNLNTDGVECITIIANDVSKIQPNIFKEIWLLPGKTEVIINPSASIPIDVKSFNGRPGDNQISDEMPKLSHIFLNVATNQQDVLNINSDTVPDVIVVKFDNYIDSVSERFRKVSPALLDAFRSNAKYFELLTFFIKYNKHKGDEEWENVLNNLIKRTDFSAPYVGLFPYFQMVSLSMFYKERGEDALKLSGDRLFTGTANYYDSLYSGKAAEAALATLLYEDGKRGLYNVSAPLLTERFIDRYPNSQFIPLLEEQVAKNVVFNNPPEHEDVIFRDNSDISSVAEILAPYKGKPVLVDLWATWCRPCLESFTHVEPLQKYAADSGLQLLYISIDEQPGIEKKWKNIALLNNLKGDHILMNAAVKDEFFSTFGTNGWMSVPAYAFVMPDGTIKFLGSELAESKDFSAVKAELDKLMNN